jgi:hypothetical protein
MEFVFGSLEMNIILPCKDKIELAIVSLTIRHGAKMIFSALITRKILTTTWSIPQL